MRIRIFQFVSLSVIVLLICPYLVIPFQSDNVGLIRSEESTAVSAEKIIDALEETYEGHFYENVGQFPDSDIRYYGVIPDGYICFAESRIILWMDGVSKP
ncbi:MAG: hypothetical protein ACW98Y_22220, partial [Candidatus Thorarchaeota archaeon]